MWVACVVHAHELEDEVGHCGEVDDDHDRLADVRFPAGDKGGEEEEADCYWNGDDGEVEFEVGEVGADDHEELHGEGKEEEEIEFEEGDVDLEGELVGRFV